MMSASLIQAPECKPLTLARTQSLQTCLGSKSVFATLHHQCQTSIDALLTLFLYGSKAATSATVSHVSSNAHHHVDWSQLLLFGLAAENTYRLFGCLWCHCDSMNLLLSLHSVLQGSASSENAVLRKQQLRDVSCMTARLCAEGAAHYELLCSLKIAQLLRRRA